VQALWTLIRGGNMDGLKAALESRGLPVTIDTSDGAEIHVAQYRRHRTVTPNVCNLHLPPTHTTRD